MMNDGWFIYSSKDVKVQWLLAILLWLIAPIKGHTVTWLRHYATSQKVTGLIPDEVTGFFN
jgi:hypothetical protein